MMKEELRTLSSVLLLSLGPVLGCHTGQAASPPASPRQIEAPTAAATPAIWSTVNITNRNWNRVTVEVRMGDDAHPENNRSLGTRSLNRGETWPLYSDGEDVWYRRDADPDRPNGQWTAWTHRPCYPNLSEVYDEIL